MPLLESILALYGTATGTASGLKDLQDFLEGRLQVEDVLTNLIEEGFRMHLPRLQHLCPQGEPVFDRKLFEACVSSGNITLSKADDLPDALLIPLRSAVHTPGATCDDRELDPIFRSILLSASRGLWHRLALAPAAARQVGLEQSDAILTQTTDIVVEQALSKKELHAVKEKLEQLTSDFAEFSKTAWKNYYDQLTDAAPPSEHRIDNITYENPFLLARSEDFNHNYSKLAKLFQGSVEWQSLQRRTDNVFLEGGRGTGKSMLLRRLTAQAVIAANRLTQPSVNFEGLKEDYFGIYVKLTRGYYEQFTALDKIPHAVGELLAQHELNIEVADAFVEALRWLWDGKHYWFTPTTLRKYERLRAALHDLRVEKSQAGRAVLLAFALSVRRCSRADQRSPKPFISKTAREKRAGKHFDPVVEIGFLLDKLSTLYGQTTGRKAKLHCDSVVCPRATIGRHTHVITSPPYINAQDYFRNFKLELYLLAGLLHFSVSRIKEQFIGTERGDVLAHVLDEDLERNRHLLPKIKAMRQTNPREAAVVDRYFWDMAKAIKNITDVLNPGGTFVLVCGDNLVAGQRIPTWRILNTITEQSGMLLKERFGDKIECRHVPPQRNGHKGLIKQEVVSVFVKQSAAGQKH